MSNGLNFNTILNVGMFAAGFFTGGATWAALGQQLLSQVGTQAFSSALDQVGVGGSLKDLALDSFSQGVGGSGGFDQELVDGLRNAANFQGADGQYTGELDRAQQDLTNQFTEFLGKAAQQRDGEDGSISGSRGGGWLVALARAMGSALGKQASEMVELSGKLDDLAGYSKDDTASASEFQKTMSEFQATSQLFGMLSNAFSNAIKAIGEGMSSMARKQ